MSHIEGLPTSIFQLIQTYLTIPEYCQLMNCNIATFQSIKYETVHFSLSDPQRWLESEEDDDDSESQSTISKENRESYFLSLLNNKVKDKSKQITITIQEITPPILLKHIHTTFQGIHKLSITNNNDCKYHNFNFHLFNNIYHIILNSFRDIEEIKDGFENVHKLHLQNFYSLHTIKNVNSVSKSLKECKIVSCLKLKTINFPLDNIETMEINCMSFTHFQSSLGKVKRLSIVSASVSMEFLDDLSNTLSTLESLALYCRFPAEFHNYHIFKNIPRLLLNRRDSASIEHFPPYRGKSLTLTGFDLSFLDSHLSTDIQSLRCLMKLELRNCHGMYHLPVMPELLDLKIYYSDALISIPTLKKLKSMRIHVCKELSMISSVQPCLEEIILERCPKVSDLSFANRPMKLLKIRECNNVSDISMLGQVNNLEINACIGVKTLTGITRTLPTGSTQNYHRKITLTDLPSVVHFSMLCSLHTLELYGMPRLLHCEGIHDVNHLVIVECPNLLTTKGLRNIVNSITITSCVSLDTLVDIQGVPEINIVYCEALKDYSSLKDHQVVMILGIPLSQQSFLQDQQHEKNIQTFVFT
eukprot:gene15295-17101_t